MKKRIRFEITADGEIRAKTLGMHGEECLEVVDVIERVVDAETVDSAFTEEFYDVKVKHHERERNVLRRRD